MSEKFLMNGAHSPFQIKVRSWKLQRILIQKTKKKQAEISNQNGMDLAERKEFTKYIYDTGQNYDWVRLSY